MKRKTIAEFKTESRAARIVAWHEKYPEGMFYIFTSCGWAHRDKSFCKVGDTFYVTGVKLLPDEELPWYKADRPRYAEMQDVIVLEDGSNVARKGAVEYQGSGSLHKTFSSRQKWEAAKRKLGITV